MKPRKFDYLSVVQGDYGQGWEDVTAETDDREGRQRLREYRENEPTTPHRIIHRRVPIAEGGK